LALASPFEDRSIKEKLRTFHKNSQLFRNNPYLDWYVCKYLLLFAKMILSPKQPAFNQIFQSCGYDLSKFTDKPPANGFQQARKYKAVQYQKVMQDLTEMKGCLASGYPFVFGLGGSLGSEGVLHAPLSLFTGPEPIQRTSGRFALFSRGISDKDTRRPLKKKSLQSIQSDCRKGAYA